MESVSRYEGRGVRFTASVTDAKIKTWEGTGGREGGTGCYLRVLGQNRVVLVSTW